MFYTNFWRWFGLQDFDKIDCDAGSPLALECHNSNASPPPMSQHSSGNASGSGGHRHHHQQQPQRPSSAQSQASTISNNNNISGGANKNHLGSLVADHASMCGISRTSPISSGDHHHQVAAAAAAHAAHHLNGTSEYISSITDSEYATCFTDFLL